MGQSKTNGMLEDIFSKVPSPRSVVNLVLAAAALCGIVTVVVSAAQGKPNWVMAGVTVSYAALTGWIALFTRDVAVESRIARLVSHQPFIVLTPTAVPSGEASYQLQVNNCGFGPALGVRVSGWRIASKAAQWEVATTVLTSIEFPVLAGQFFQPFVRANDQQTPNDIQTQHGRVLGQRFERERGYSPFGILCLVEFHDIYGNARELLECLPEFALAKDEGPDSQIA